MQNHTYTDMNGYLTLGSTPIEWYMDFGSLCILYLV